MGDDVATMSQHEEPTDENISKQFIANCRDSDDNNEDGLCRY